MAPACWRSLLREVAEDRATLATDMARLRDYPLLFTTEPED
nr:hypothetical protein [uncultured Lichenicoccus sp.]